VESSTQLIAELKLSANEALPIKTFPSFEVDPLAAITAALAQFDETKKRGYSLLSGLPPNNGTKRVNATLLVCVVRLPDQTS